VNVSFDDNDLDERSGEDIETSSYGVLGGRLSANSQLDVQRAAGLFKKDERYQKLLQEIEEINTTSEQPFALGQR